MIGSIADRTILNNGVGMPWLGFGVYGLNDVDEVVRCVGHALQLGYRSIDTATVYGNERGVGRAIRECDIPREDIFLTTKVWNDDQRERRTLAAFEESLERLRVEYVDLYLVHWPVPDCYVHTWKEMEKIYESGRARAVGVSNFLPQHLDNLKSASELVPAVNQVEFHPRLVQPALLEACRERDIRVEAWSPLMQGRITGEAVILELADKYRRTPAQITLRWDLQHGVVTIPKSARLERIAENAGVFDFEISDEDMHRLDALDSDERLGPDPANFDH
ncbi:MAG: aldo/keto reductase [Woeseiaceae bacterium]